MHTDYDNDFRAASETVNGSGAVSFGYDDDGLMTSAGALTRTLDPATAQLTTTAVGDVSDSYTYNAYGELETYDASYLGSSMLSTTYTRDALGRISSKTETVEGETHSFVYRYDLRGRLYQVERDGLVEEEYTYDANGNRDGGTYDDQDRLLAYGGKTYTYTANGELSSCSDGTQYSYDAQGALLSVDLPDGRLVEYLIDGQGRRVGKKVDGVLQWGLGVPEPAAARGSVGWIRGCGGPLCVWVVSERPGLCGAWWVGLSDHHGPSGVGAARRGCVDWRGCAADGL